MASFIRRYVKLTIVPSIAIIHCPSFLNTSSHFFLRIVISSLCLFSYRNLHHLFIASPTAPAKILLEGPTQLKLIDSSFLTTIHNNPLSLIFFGFCSSGNSLLNNIQNLVGISMRSRCFIIMSKYDIVSIKDECSAVICGLFQLGW